MSKTRCLGCGLLLLAAALAAALAPPQSDISVSHPLAGRRALQGAAAFVLAAVGLAAIATPQYRRSASWWRLDWFFAMVRKPARGESAPATSWLRASAQRWLGPAWFSDRATKRRGRLRRWLDRCGPTWTYAPLRRLSQAACLALFLVLFFYVCWPYDARPAAPGPSSSGWQLVEVDQAQGTIHLRQSRPDGQWRESWLRPAAPLFLVDASAESAPADGPRTAAAGSVVSAHVVERGEGRLAVSSESVEQLEQVLTSPGPWAVHRDRPHAWPSHYADRLAAKERVPADLFLTIDPLVGLSTAVASRSWVWSLASAGCILIVCVLIPRGFCGYLCPLGTLIDVFDWAVGRRVTRFRVRGDGWWVHIKYYLLLGVMIAALGGVLVSGFVAAIPVVTRGMLFLGEPLQTAALRGRRLATPVHWGHGLSIAMFLGVLALGLLRPRFWCKYVCPSGAVFSLANLFRISERKVESSCIHCNKCVEVCPFDAIKPDFTTRATDCTLCQTCAGVCPTEAIKFVERWNLVQLKAPNDPPTGETGLGRRGFLSLAAGGAAAVAGGVALTAAGRGAAAGPALVRPPGSVPEPEFLEMCIRCGECFKVCPNNVLQAEGFQQGLAGLWAPLVAADWAGCESSCNACGQVCPTGAIRALPLDEKRVARMGLAVVNQQTCLPLAGREPCDLCVQECDAAGYHAIEFQRVLTEMDDRGAPVEGSGFLAPVVRADLCVGCGLCQTRCFGINVKSKRLLEQSAIVVVAGPENEDRISTGSYVELRAREAAERAAEARLDGGEFFVPDAPPPGGGFHSPETGPPAAPGDDPFGVAPDPFGLQPPAAASPRGAAPPAVSPAAKTPE